MNTNRIWKRNHRHEPLFGRHNRQVVDLRTPGVCLGTHELQIIDDAVMSFCAVEEIDYDVAQNDQVSDAKSDHFVRLLLVNPRDHVEEAEH